MREQTLKIDERRFISITAKVIYEMSPLYQPRNIETIMKEAQKKFKDASVVTDYAGGEVYFRNEKDLRQFVKQLLFSIPEFKQLNLSQAKIDAGITDPDAPANKSQVYIDLITNNQEKWYRDFVDTWACTRNIANELISYYENIKDCLTCNNTDPDRCKTCYLNSEFTDNYVSTNTEKELKGVFTRGCRNTCPKGNYICCSDCEEFEECNIKEFKCTDDPNKCGLLFVKEK